jgi:hypothetical protein
MCYKLLLLITDIGRVVQISIVSQKTRWLGCA